LKNGSFIDYIFSVGMRGLGGYNEEMKLFDGCSNRKVRWLMKGYCNSLWKNTWFFNASIAILFFVFYFKVFFIISFASSEISQFLSNSTNVGSTKEVLPLSN